MASILKALRLAADPNRLRILLLLEQEELSVAELQEILAKGQSQISTYLAQLKQAELVDDRRTGKNAFYRLNAPTELMDLLRKAASLALRCSINELVSSDIAAHTISPKPEV